MAEVRWTKEAISDLKSLDKAVAKRIVRKISWFSENFDNITPETLSGELSDTLLLFVYKIS